MLVLSPMFAPSVSLDTHRHLIIVNAHVLSVEGRVQKCIEVSLEGVTSPGLPRVAQGLPCSLSVVVFV